MVKQFRSPVAVNLTAVIVVILAITILLLVNALTSSAQNDGNVIIIGGDEASMRKFITRTEGLLAVADDANVTIHIAALTEALPFDLPLPDDARPVGSIATEFGDSQLFRLIVDTNLAPADVAAFYEEQFSDDRWEPFAGMNTAPGGFADMDMASLIYCYGDEASVNVNAFTLSSGLTDLQFYITHAQNNGPCQSGIPGPSSSNAVAIMPQLGTPTGITRTDGATHSLSDRPNNRAALSTATLTSQLVASDTLELYNEQLFTAGWTLLNQGGGTDAAWSVWEWINEEDDTLWHGTLTITPVATTGSPDAAATETYQAMLYITE